MLILCFSDPDTACLENYPIHTITGLVKRWLRELPDPLMTFNLYNDFLHAAGGESLTMWLITDSIRKRETQAPIQPLLMTHIHLASPYAVGYKHSALDL